MLLQAVVAVLARSLRALLNTTFGWATALLFGKVPADRQIVVSLTRSASTSVTPACITDAEQLAHSGAYLTWTKEANELEDRLHGLWCEIKAGASSVRPGEAASRLRSIERDLREVRIPYDEWETLFREKLLAERGLLHVIAGGTDRPQDLAEALGATEDGAARGGAGCSGRDRQQPHAYLHGMGISPERSCRSHPRFSLE